MDNLPEPASEPSQIRQKVKWYLAKSLAFMNFLENLPGRQGSGAWIGGVLLFSGVVADISHVWDNWSIDWPFLFTEPLPAQRLVHVLPTIY